MSNHGVVAYGVDLHSAYMKMETVEHFAQIALVTHLLGRQQPLGSVELEKLMAARSKYQGSTSSAPLPLAVPCDGDGGYDSQPQEEVPVVRQTLAAGQLAAPIGPRQKKRGRVARGHTSATTLLSSDSESHAGPDVNPQRRVTHDFLILLVESVFHVYIAGDSGSHCIPTAEIDARISGRVVDVVAQEIGVGPPSDKTSAEIGSPSIAEVGQHHRSRMLGTPDQWLARLEERIEGKRLFEDLGRSVGIGPVERQPGQGPSVKLQFGSMRQGLIDIHILSAERGWAAGRPRRSMS